MVSNEEARPIKIISNEEVRKAFEQARYATQNPNSPEGIAYSKRLNSQESETTRNRIREGWDNLLAELEIHEYLTAEDLSLQIE